jgi:hypothetical protein
MSGLPPRHAWTRFASFDQRQLSSIARFTAERQLSARPVGLPVTKPICSKGEVASGTQPAKMAGDTDTPEKLRRQAARSEPNPISMESLEWSHYPLTGSALSLKMLDQLAS